MLAHYSLPDSSYQEPRFKEEEEIELFSCDCCGEEFQSGSEFSDGENKYYFKAEHRRFNWHLEVLRDAGLPLCKIMNLKERTF